MLPYIHISDPTTQPKPPVQLVNTSSSPPLPSQVYIYPNLVLFVSSLNIPSTYILVLAFYSWHKKRHPQRRSSQKKQQWENLVVTKKAPTKVLGPSKKTKSSLITSKLMVKAVGVPFPRLLVSLYYSIPHHIPSINWGTKASNSTYICGYHYHHSYISGLHRCGKSCRLRWLNYLRPDIKRGVFAQDEEDLIIKLHALLGNRYIIFSLKLLAVWPCHYKREILFIHYHRTPYTIILLSHKHTLHPSHFKARTSRYLYTLILIYMSILHGFRFIKSISYCKNCYSYSREIFGWKLLFSLSIQINLWHVLHYLSYVCVQVKNFAIFYYHNFAHAKNWFLCLRLRAFIQNVFPQLHLTSFSKFLFYTYL